MDLGNLDTMVSRLLTTVYQGTENSGSKTLESARELAKSLGATFYLWNVQPLFDDYSSIIEGSLGRQLSWEQDDIALQNIQARLRSPGVWMIANINKALLLTTSNRSEAAVGYATMDGDTSGGLAPLGGIDKAFLLQFLRWAEPNAGPGRVEVCECPPTHSRVAPCRKRTDRRRRPHALPHPRQNRKSGHPRLQKPGGGFQDLAGNPRRRLPQRLYPQVLHIVVAQPMETRTLCTQLPPRR
jgi:hypothetical protein